MYLQLKTAGPEPTNAHSSPLFICVSIKTNYFKKWILYLLPVGNRLLYNGKKFCQMTSILPPSLEFPTIKMITQIMVVNFTVTNVSHSLILIICLQADFSLEFHDNLRDNIVHLPHCTMSSVFGKVKKKWF